MNLFNIMCEGLNLNGRAVATYIQVSSEYRQAFCPEGSINTDDF